MLPNTNFTARLNLNQPKLNIAARGMRVHGIHQLTAGEDPGLRVIGSVASANCFHDLTPLCGYRVPRVASQLQIAERMHQEQRLKSDLPVDGMAYVGCLQCRHYPNKGKEESHEG